MSELVQTVYFPDYVDIGHTNARHVSICVTEIFQVYISMFVQRHQSVAAQDILVLFRIQ